MQGRSKSAKTGAISPTPHMPPMPPRTLAAETHTHTHIHSHRDRTSRPTQAGIGHSAPAHRGGHAQNMIRRTASRGKKRTGLLAEQPRAEGGPSRKAKSCQGRRGRGLAGAHRRRHSKQGCRCDDVDGGSAPIAMDPVGPSHVSRACGARLPTCMVSRCVCTGADAAMWPGWCTCTSPPRIPAALARWFRA